MSFQRINDDEFFTSYADAAILIESGGRADARAPTSSATGAAQFINSTWLGMLRKHRPDLMEGRDEQEILDLRLDPGLSREMAIQYARDNGAYLRRRGAAVDHGALYLAHFLGGGGAARALSRDPSAPIAEAMSAAQIEANKTIRFNGKTLPDWTAGDLHAWASAKMARAARRAAIVPATSPLPVARDAAPEIQPAPEGAEAPEGERPPRVQPPAPEPASGDISGDGSAAPSAVDAGAPAGDLSPVEVGAPPAQPDAPTREGSFVQGAAEEDDAEMPGFSDFSPAAFRAEISATPKIRPLTGFWSDVGDSFMDSGPVEAVLRMASVPTHRDPGFDPFAEIRARDIAPGGGEWRVLQYAGNRDEFDYRLQRIDEQRARRARMASSDRIVAPLLGALLTPESLVSIALIPATGGAGFLVSGGRIGAATLALEGGAEMVRRTEVADIGAGESVTRVAAATIFAGAVAGGLGALGKARVERMARDFAQDMAALQGAGAFTSRLRFGDRAVNWTGLPDHAPSAARALGVFVDDLSEPMIHVDLEQIVRGHQNKIWRTLGLSDELFPNANAWGEYVIRLKAAQAERGISIPGLRVSDDADPALRKTLNAEAEKLMVAAREDALIDFNAWRAENRIALKNRFARRVWGMVGTPYKRVHLRALGQGAVDMVDGLAMDAGLAGLGAAAGRTTGPSVAMLSKVWMGMAHVLKDAEDAIYVRDYLGFGTQPRVGDIDLRKSFGRARADGSAAMTVAEFRTAAFKVVVTGTESKEKAVNAYAEELRKYFARFKDEAMDAGILGQWDNRAMRIKKKRLEDLIAKAEGRKTRQGARFRPEDQLHLDMWKNELAEVDRRLAADLMPEGEADYMSRIWNHHAIRKSPETFRNLLRRKLAGRESLTLIDAEGRESVVEATNDAIERYIDDLMETILSSDDLADFNAMMSKGPGFLRERAFPVLNRDLIDVTVDAAEGTGKVDFIETDATLIAFNYAQRMGPWIEYSRRFGDPTRTISVDASFANRLLAAKADERAAWKGTDEAFDAHWATIERDVMFLRDRVTNRVVSDPGRWDNRMAEVLRNWAHVAFMGASALAAIPDAAKIVSAHGVRRVFGEAFKLLDAAGASNFGLMAREARVAGALTDVAMGTAIRHFAEAGTEALNVTKLERGLRGLTQKFFVLNGLAPLSYALKSFTGALTQHDMIDKAIAWAAGDLDEGGQAFLTQYGIDRRMALKIAKMHEAGHLQRLDGASWLANTESWTDREAQRSFRAALNQHVENTILMASAADRPALVQGALHFRSNPGVDRLAKRFGWTQVNDGYWRVQSGLLGLPFQFWNFGFAAMNKITAAALENPNARMLTGLAMMAGLGYMVETMRTPASVREKWDATETIYRVIHRAGLAGLLTDWAFTAQDVAGMATGVNINPFAGYRYGDEAPGPGDAAFGLLGAGPAVARNAILGSYSAAHGDPDGARMLSWAMPFRNYPVVGGVINDAVSEIEDQRNRAPLRF